MSGEDGGPPDGLERKLATILSADVAGFSRLMAEDEEATLRIFRGHSEVFTRPAELHRGRVFNTAGDAIPAEFNSAVEAVRCATEIQAALRTRNDQLPEARQVRFRIGVNLGDVMVQGRDLLGDGVNVAARLQTAAEPGGVCISGSVYDQIRNKLSLSFTPLGERNYKNIPQAVRTFAIAGSDGLGVLPLPQGRPPGGRRRLAAWAALVLALLLIAGGGWTYYDRQRAEALAARAESEKRAAAEAAEQKRAAEAQQRAAAQHEAEAERERAALAAEKVAAEEAQKRAEAERQAAAAARQQADLEWQLAQDRARRLAEEERRRRAEAPQQTALAAPPSPPERRSAAADGLYRGPICYGPGANDPARCYRAQAVVQSGRISGQWPGREPGVTMHLDGTISAGGDVAIHMHGDRSDGSHLAVIDLGGTLRDGRLDAKGGFRNGRSVTLNWNKN